MVEAEGAAGGAAQYAARIAAAQDAGVAAIDRLSQRPDVALVTAKIAWMTTCTLLTEAFDTGVPVTGELVAHAVEEGARVAGSARRVE